MAERTGTAVQRAQESVAIAKPESLLERVDEVFNQIRNRAFEMFDVNGRVFGRELDDWLKAERQILHPVQIHLSESGDSFEVKAEVPGFTEKELEISAEPGRVTISGKRETSKEEKKGKTVYSETGSDQILRVVELPTTIDTDKVTATVKNGILTLVLPKAANARTVREPGRSEMPQWSRPRSGWKHVLFGRGLSRSANTLGVILLTARSPSYSQHRV